MLKIYLASRFSRIAEMRGYRSALEEDGNIVTSRWLNEEEPGEGDDSYIPSEASAEFAVIDVEDVAGSDVVLSFTEPPRSWTRGGRHVEFGLGLAWGKHLVIVGPKENVFHTLKTIHQFDTFDWARLYLKEVGKRWNDTDGLTRGMDRWLAPQIGRESSEYYSSPDHVTGPIPPLSKEY